VGELRVHESQDYDRAFVEGHPIKVLDHAAIDTSGERGEYLSTVFISIRGQQVAIPVFSKDVADLVASALFRQHSLAFDEQYIPGEFQISICCFVNSVQKIDKNVASPEQG
jgi:hypothetical protein